MEMFGQQTRQQQMPLPQPRQKPRWLENEDANRYRKTIGKIADIRSQYFTAYAFGGGWVADREWTQVECAEMIVLCSDAMLEAMKCIGRQPIGGQDTIDKYPPSIEDKDWIAHLRQTYCLYPNTQALLDLTDGIIEGRDVNTENIKITELTEG